ncbi:uncharacterized protein HKW66_Vig0248590 [Vigna angularis]|uniref:rRNA methyltransferase 2, mitochondrial n=1 Tax=Phaseolus angularis TaxID=3914 RepID=A0A8T0JUT1_PHAAN|nr:uncharacterized protein HKW66_Vig0248590 [Vigna angularis]
MGSAFKLLHIQKQHNIINRGATVLDLGCAFGGWLQVACQSLGPFHGGGSVLGVDTKKVKVPPFHCDYRAQTILCRFRPSFAGFDFCMVLFSLEVEALWLSLPDDDEWRLNRVAPWRRTWRLAAALAWGEMGYAFKLLHIQKQHNIINRGTTVLDLGCAFGGWLQVACQSLGPFHGGGSVLGVDTKKVKVPPFHCDYRAQTILCRFRPSFAGFDFCMVLFSLEVEALWLSFLDDDEWRLNRVAPWRRTWRLAAALGDFQNREKMRVEKALRQLYGCFFYRFSDGKFAADVYQPPEERKTEMNLVIVSHGQMEICSSMEIFSLLKDLEDLSNQINM